MLVGCHSLEMQPLKVPITSAFLFSCLILIFHEVNLCEKFFWIWINSVLFINFLKPENPIFLKKIAVVHRSKVMITKYVSHDVVT